MTVNVMEAEERIENAIRTYPSVKKLMQAEPAIPQLMRLAAEQDDKASRWEQYEILKRVCQGFVGWSAQNPTLRDKDSYTLMMSVLDILLPTPEIDYFTMADANREVELQRLRDAVKTLFPQIEGERS
jgi:hypothetical protein